MALLNPTHGMYLAVIGLYIISWLILLAGLSAVQHTCNDSIGRFQPFTVYPSLANVVGEHCHKLFRFPWFLVWLGILPLLIEAGALMAMITRKTTSHNPRSTVGKGAALFAVIAVLYIIMTNEFYKMVDDGGVLAGVTGGFNKSGAMSSRFKCTLAGFALTAAFALLAMLLAPWTDEHDHDDGRSMTTTQSEKRTGIATGGPTTTAAPAHVIV